MKNSSLLIKVLAMLAFSAASCLSLAEYEVLSNVEYDAKHPKNSAWFRKPSDSQIDQEACQAVIENMNILEKYGIDMKEDFPISSSSPLLLKPEWRKITQAEYEEVCSFIGEKNKFSKCVFNKDSLYVYDYVFKPDNIFISIYRNDFPYLSGHKTARSYYFVERENGKLVKSKNMAFGDDGYYDESNIEAVLYKNNFYRFRYASILGQPYKISDLGGFGEKASHGSTRRIGMVSVCYIKSK